LCAFLDFDLLGIEILFPDVATLAVLEELEAVLKELSLALNVHAALLDAVTKWEALLAKFNCVQSENKGFQRFQNRKALLLDLARETAKLTASFPEKFEELHNKVLDWEMANRVEFEVRD
jgi:hypothetical protein